LVDRRARGGEETWYVHASGRIVGNERGAVSTQTEVDIGTDFVGYRIEEWIGRGGMGVVYRAYDLRLKRTVALKLVTPELASDDRFRQRFARESELAMSLEHPNVVPIHDAGDVDGRLYLAMRLVDGTDLRALLRAEGALEAARAIAICRQVAHALDAAHSKGLVHRDVKPSNVLLDENDHVYLADFGLTRRLDEQGVGTGEGRSVGTPAYLAPEQIEGGGLIDGRADVYSLGCLLFECLTGQEPFPRDSRLAVAWAHLEAEPPSASALDSELPSEIDDVIRKAMEKDPDDRYSTCSTLIAAAENALGLPQTRRHGRRALSIASAIVLIAVAATLLATVLTRADSSSSRSPLFAHPNTLVRIDPRANEVRAVVGVGASPQAVAAYGQSVWVYSHADGSVSEIDARTDTVLHTTVLSATPDHLSWRDGPVLAADAAGAWIVGVEARGEYRLTRILARHARTAADGAGKIEYALHHEPVAVVVGASAVWVLSRAPRDVVLRIDPLTGKTTTTTVLPTSFSSTGLGVGAGAVWVVASNRASATLFRIDARSGKLSGTRHLPPGATPPRVAVGTRRRRWVWIAVPRWGGTMYLVNPRTLEVDFRFDALSPDESRVASAFGSDWSLDSPAGAVVRFTRWGEPDGGMPVAEIPVTRVGPKYYGSSRPTSIAAGAGGIWVTVAEGFPTTQP
jgi:serine/threonine-protein kinase